MSDIASDSIGGFELRLLEELELLVEAPGPAVLPARRLWLPRRFVLALVVVALVVGATAASIGAWRLIGRTDWELSSQGEETVVGTFLGTHPIELASVSGASGYEVLTGQVNVPDAASVAVVLPEHQNLPVQLEGRLFLVALSPAHRHPESVLALDAAGRVVARARP